MLPLGDRVALAVLKQFDSLKPRGKPQGREWTVLAGLVAQDTRKTCCTDASATESRACSCLTVVSLATGNKCVGNGHIPDDGSVVHDSHAEVLARRALLLRLWKELHLRASSSDERQEDVANEGGSASDNGSLDGRTKRSRARVSAEAELYGGVLPEEEREDERRLLLLLERSPRAKAGGHGAWRLKSHVRLHLYISDAPCGDASIYEQKRRGARSDGVTLNGGRDSWNSHVSGDAGGGDNARSGGNGEAGGGGRESRGDDRGNAKRHRPADANPEARGGQPLPHPDRPLLDTGDGPKRSLEAMPDTLRRGVHQTGNGEGGGTAGGAGGGGRGGTGPSETMAFTGAKIISAVKEKGAPDRSFREGGEGGLGGSAATGELVLRIDREQQQQLGALRIKSSRSNISEEGRTMSMSCSDKLAKWAFLGVQGGLLASWVEPIFLSSIVVSADPRSDGPGALSSSLARAIPGRAGLALAISPSLPFPAGSPPSGGAQPAAVAKTGEKISSPSPEPEPEPREAMRVLVTEVTFDRSKAQSEQQVFEEAAASSSAGRAGAAYAGHTAAPAVPVASRAPAGSTPTTTDATGGAAAVHLDPEDHGQGARSRNVSGKKDTRNGDDSNKSKSSSSSSNSNGNSSGSSRGTAGSNGSRKDAGSRRDRRPKKAVPSGTSLNWIEGLGTGRGAGPGGGDAARVQAEVTLSATGRMQGAVSKGVQTLRTRSRLCRARLLEAAELVARAYSPQSRCPPFFDQGDVRDDDRKDDVGEAGGKREGGGAGTLAGEGCIQGGGGKEKGGGGGGGGEGKGGTQTGERRSYWQLKRACDAYRRRREAMLMTPTFGAWLVGDKTKQQFAVDAITGVVPLAASSGGAPYRSSGRGPPGPPAVSCGPAIAVDSRRNT